MSHDALPYQFAMVTYGAINQSLVQYFYLQNGPHFLTLYRVSFHVRHGETFVTKQQRQQRAKR
jgi:hypothetical protein